MRRILFRWRAWNIWSFPALLYCGLVAGVAAGNLAAHATGANAFRVFVATLILILPALAGARILYVGSHWGQYRSRRERIWDRREGGMAMYGGMPVTLLLSIPLLAALKVRLGVFWDAASFTIMTGIVFAKIGCLLNGCCAGRPYKGFPAVRLPNAEGVWTTRIPVQCLEAAWAATVLAIAVALSGTLPFHGALFLVVAMLYGAGRLAFESLREPEPGASPLTIGRTFSLLTVIGSIAILVVRWPR